jgi:two-component system, OmpR family, response regulator
MSPQKHIILVEDDDLIRENYSDILEDEGYKVNAYADRESAFTAIQSVRPHLAIIDIALGRERDGGIRLCNKIRESDKNLPIIFLTSYASDSERIAGMKCEIDDYIIKTESIDYLIVRISTLLKRVEGFSQTNREIDVLFTQGELILDTETCIAFWKDAPLDINLTQYWVLKELAIRPGQAKSPSKLMEAANMVVEPNTISANIKSIRKSFKQIDPEFDCIRAVYGSGYRWVEP